MALFEGRYDITTRTLADGEVAPIALTSAGLIKTDAAGGGGGGGGAVTVADGADVTQGAVADAAATAGGTGTESAKLRLMTTQLNTLAGHLDGVETKLDALVAQQAGGTLTNRSGTITAGGTSQQLAAANAARRYLFVQNPSTQTESLFVNFTSAALLGTSYELVPGGSLEMSAPNFVSTEVVTVIAATTAHPFAAKEG